MHLFFSFSLNHIPVFLVHIEEISLMSLRWCMGHLSTLMWVKVHNNNNPFTGLEFTIFTILYKCMTKMFEEVKILKGPARFKLVTYKFVTNGLTN